MKSKLFSKLAQGALSILNFPDKVEIDEVIRIEPREDDTAAKLYKLATRYYKHLVVQDQYVKLCMRMMDQVEHEISKLDLIQANHEDEMEKVKAEAKALIAGSKLGLLHNKIQQLESELIRKQRYIDNELRRPLVNVKDANKFLYRLERIDGKIGVHGADSKTAKELMDVLKEILSKNE